MAAPWRRVMTLGGYPLTASNVLPTMCVRGVTCSRGDSRPTRALQCGVYYYVMSKGIESGHESTLGRVAKDALVIGAVAMVGAGLLDVLVPGDALVSF